MRPNTLVVLFTICGSLVAAQVEGRFERTLTVSGPVELDAQTDAGGIDVKAGPSGSVLVRAILKSSRGDGPASPDVERRIRAIESNPPVEQTGNRIRVGHVTDPELLRGVSMRLEILTPPQTRVEARADSGGVLVSGVAGPVVCHTDSGGIDIADIGADVKATVDSGGIRIANVRGSVSAQADSGGIVATGVAGALDVSTDSGGITVSQTVPAPIRARADSGGAVVRLAQTGGYDLVLESGSGRVTGPEMTVQGNLSNRRMQGKMRGGGPLVDVRVDSGTVKVE